MRRLLPDRFSQSTVALSLPDNQNATNGKNAHIIAKINALCDIDIIKALYNASMAGVKVDLIIRGICCLRTGIPGVSENITVKSVVGRFLEHSRIFYFENAGRPEIYCGSSDWMPRNLERRVEILFPIEDEKLKERVLHILDIMLKDNLKASVMNDEGDYKRIDKRGKVLIGCQSTFCEEAIAKAKANLRHQSNPNNMRTFIPKKNLETN